jgi:cell division protein YceG involved in septum cleavage
MITDRSVNRRYYGRPGTAAAVLRKDRKNNSLVIVLTILAAVIALLICLRMSVWTASADTPDHGTKYYKSVTIESGDTLWSIAEQDMTPGWDDIRDYIAEVEQINSLDGDSIHAGNSIIVPYYLK